MALETFASARDLFDAARDAALECDRTRRMLMAMESAEQTAGSQLGAKVSHGSISDPMRRVDARIDRESALYQRIEEDEALMDAATRVLYGAEQDGNGGVCAMLGTVYADVLWWHYLACETWLRTGAIVGYSQQHCKRFRDVAFELIDAHGIAAVIAGDGMAET